MSIFDAVFFTTKPPVLTGTGVVVKIMAQRLICKAHYKNKTNCNKIEVHC